jgi:hypothetical protein
LRLNSNSKPTQELRASRRDRRPARPASRDALDLEARPATFPRRLL